MEFLQFLQYTIISHLAHDQMNQPKIIICKNEIHSY